MCNNQGSELHNKRPREGGETHRDPKHQLSPCRNTSQTSARSALTQHSSQTLPCTPATRQSLTCAPFGWHQTTTSYETPKSAQKFQTFQGSLSASPPPPPHCSGRLWDLSCPLMLLLGWCHLLSSSTGAASAPQSSFPKESWLFQGIEPEMLCGCTEWPFKQWLIFSGSLLRNGTGTFSRRIS